MTSPFDMDVKTQLALRSEVTLDLDQARPVTVSMRPGSYGADDRRVTVQIDHVAIRLNLSGDPEVLRAWAEHLVRVATDLAYEADDLEDFLLQEAETHAEAAGVGS